MQQHFYNSLNIDIVIHKSHLKIASINWSTILVKSVGTIILFMADDFKGSLSKDLDCVSPPTPLPPVNVDENLEKKKNNILNSSFRIVTF